MRRHLATLLVGACLVLVTGCGSVGPAPRPPSTSRTLLGAYVDPPVYTETERIDAFERFEKLLGTRLDVFHDFHTWTDPFPSEADRYFARRDTLVLLSWAGTDTKPIISGAYDDMIRQRARALRALDRPVLLRWRWEMNRPNLREEIGSPADYVAAWRHLHRIFDEERASRVSWVWCPLSDRGADLDFERYYPGDDAVDWICADGYARDEQESFEAVFAPFLTWAQHVRKPVLIGEFGRSEGEPGTRARWLDEARAFIKATPQIRAVAYFESARGASGKYDLTSETSALQAFRRWPHDDHFGR